MKNKTYKGKYTREICFPLGGIGSGCIGLSGNGMLRDFELFGRPNKKSLPGLTFFAIKAEHEGKLLDARVLNGDSFDTRSGFEAYPEFGQRLICKGYGYGPSISTMAGVPHFPAVDFISKFPFAELNFSYEGFPGKVKMTAFSPFIPLNENDSSLPAAFFEFEIFNDTDKTLDYTLCSCVENSLERGKNTFDGEVEGNMKCIRLFSTDDIDDDNALDSQFDAKNLCIATDSSDISYQEYLFRGTWFDKLQVFWNDFTKDSIFRNRHYTESGKNDVGLIAAHISIAPGEKKTVKFVLSWFARFYTNYWSPTVKTDSMTEREYIKSNRWRTHYTRFFASSMDCAKYCFAQWDRLKNESMQFADTLFSSTLPEEVLDAVSANLCILKSSTLLRHSDGSILGFEGAHAQDGSCEGNCTHVYSYAYALAHLFPALERGLRENEYRYCMDINGAVNFRIPAPIGRTPDYYFPCADGQMMGIVKTYREFKLSGDKDWLASIWPHVRISLHYAFSAENDFRWDLQKTGILSGRQHNTLDTELYSPNSWLQGLYCAALLCAAEISEVLGEEPYAKMYRDMYESGRSYLNNELFNGKYYYQKIDLCDRSLLSGFKLKAAHNTDVYDYYWNEEAGEIKYQIGDGSSVDQALAQWHANNIGLGDIYDPEKLRSALQTIYETNFKKSMRDFFNPCRNFCINDEAGVTICTYPEGAKKPVIPIPYAEECMNGFEYQAACLMIQSGMVSEGLEIVRAIRSRYDGEYRNPFSEMECGSSYVRSLSSYTLLNAFCGLGYDIYHQKIVFKPLLEFSEQGYFKSFFSVGSAYGTVEVGPKYIEMKLLGGEFKLRRFELFAEPKIVYYCGRKIDFDAHGELAVFKMDVLCNKHNAITIIFD